MKFRRLVDNEPAYKVDKVYSVVRGGCKFRDQIITGLTIENDLGSQFYYSLYGRDAAQEFYKLWKREE